MLTINFNPFPNLVSDRLLLRRTTAADVPEMFALRSNAEIMKYIPRTLHTTHNDTLTFIKRMDDMVAANEGIQWGIALKGMPQIIGTAGIYRIKPENHRAELGYMLLPEYEGQGIATEATKLMLDFGFNHLNLHSFEAIIDPGNIASEKVLQKTGFVKEGHIRENELYNGVFLDTVIYSLLKRNYKQ